MNKSKGLFINEQLVITFLTVALLLFAVFELMQVAMHPYILDIIGRSLRVASIEMSNGRPMYSAPALAMSYTPGYILLNAGLFKAFGFSYQLWNAIWAFSGLSFLFVFSWYFWRTEKALTPIVPAALLSCLFPFLWARGDLYAIILFGIGLCVLDPLVSKRASYRRELVAIILFGLSLFFKQTMLPIIGGAILLSGHDSIFSRSNLLRTTRVFLLSGLFFCLLMIVYMTVFGENINDIIKVLGLGKGHALLLDNALRYSIIYLCITIPPCLYIWKNERWAISRALMLFLVGISYVLFSTKDGGNNWHHFLNILLPWMWLIAKTRMDDRATPVPVSGKALWVLILMLLGFAYVYSPTVPKIATPSDVLSVKELKNMLSKVESTNEYALFLDSESKFSFPEMAYVSAYKPRYERGPLEEWSGAEKQLMNEIIDDLQNKLFINIYMRKGNDIGGTAYGISYEPMYNALRQNYKLCELRYEYWTVLCRN